MNDNDRKRIDESNHKLVKDLKPQKVFEFFADLSAIPRKSGDVHRVGEFLERFAAERGLEHERDAVGNVIIRKPGQKSASKDGVILQAHQDMVAVKTAAADHNFDTDPIEFVMENGWLRANGTTLGADDGMGVAIALAALDDQTLSHPPLECYFTVDEETDMKGAKAMKAESFKGDALINLDAEELGFAYISAAGGVTSAFAMPLPADKDAREATFRAVRVSGLLGGHSGVEINKGRANAYVLLARFLAAAADEKIAFFLHVFEQGEGGGADNAIPDRALAVIGLASDADAEAIEALAKKWDATFKNEFRASDAGVSLAVAAHDKPAQPAIATGARDRFLAAIRLMPLGVFRFIQTPGLMKDGTVYKDLLVETSCNMGRLTIAGGRAEATLFARGSTDSVLDDLTSRAMAVAEMAGGKLGVVNAIAGWEMSAEPTRLQRLFAKQGLACIGIHAGLECGCMVDIFKRAGRSLDAVSVGPTMTDVHSPKEQIDVATVETLWKQLTAVLAEI